MITNRKQQLLGFSSSPKLITKLSMRVVSLLQDSKPGDIIISLAVLFLTVCEKFDYDPVEALPIAQNLRNRTYEHSHHTELKALEEYVEHELTNR